MPRISQLPSQTTLADNDQLAVVSTAGAITDKISGKDLAAGIAGKLPAGSVSATAINPSTVKTPNIGVIQGTTLQSTGNKSITGVGFKPSIVRFTLLPTGSYGTSGISSIGVGAMTATSSFSAAIDVDSNNRTRDNSTNSIRLKVAPSIGAPQLEFKYVSMDADGFTINVTSAVNFAVAYEAYP